MKPEVISLSQHRGQRYASVKTERNKQMLNTERVAVIRDWENGMLDWSQNPPTYLEREEDGWWTHPAATIWRSLLTEGAAVWVRKVKHDDSENASVGRSVGIWRIGDVVVAGRHLSFTLQARLGEVI